MEKLVKKPLNVKRRFARTTEQDKISGYVLTYLSACEHLIAIDSFQIDHAQTFLQLSNLLLNINFNLTQNFENLIPFFLDFDVWFG